jgi:hypothetical protein
MLVLALFSAGAKIRDRAFISVAPAVGDVPAVAPDAVRADHSCVLRTGLADSGAAGE